MSCVYKGRVIDTDLSKKANGGTEQMRSRLIANVPQDLLSKFAIHLSRPRQIYSDVKNILWCHDLVGDPENRILKDHRTFDHYVFVSRWQKDQYQLAFGLPFSKCSVIQNAIETKFDASLIKPKDRINLIYHTTPHRGLELVYPIFQSLKQDLGNLHLDVFSSFAAYGWSDRDRAYSNLFDLLRSDPQISYHGYKENGIVIDYLKQAHIFLYPCIWQETSCIALIEAIRHGVIAVHPDFGALAETSSGQTLMFDMHEDKAILANRCLIKTKEAIHRLNKIRIDGTLPENSIEVFKDKWTKLLSNLLIT